MFLAAVSLAQAASAAKYECSISADTQAAARENKSLRFDFRTKTIELTNTRAYYDKLNKRVDDFTIGSIESRDGYDVIDVKLTREDDQQDDDAKKGPIELAISVGEKPGSYFARSRSVAYYEKEEQLPKRVELQLDYPIGLSFMDSLPTKNMRMRVTCKKL